MTRTGPDPSARKHFQPPGEELPLCRINRLDRSTTELSLVTCWRCLTKARHRLREVK